MAKVEGADRIARKLKSLPTHLEAKVGAAVKKSADELVRTSKVLIPVGGDIHGDGHEREKITATQVDVMAFEVDFGPKAKVIEGDKGPRPFVNPALKVTRKRNGARIRRAVRAAVKAAMNGG